MPEDINSGPRRGEESQELTAFGLSDAISHPPQFTWVSKSNFDIVKLTDATSLANQQVFSIFSPSPQHWDYRHAPSCPAFYMDTRRPSSRPGAYVAST